MGCIVSSASRVGRLEMELGRQRSEFERFVEVCNFERETNSVELEGASAAHQIAELREEIEQLKRDIAGGSQNSQEKLGMEIAKQLGLAIQAATTKAGAASIGTPGEPSSGRDTAISTVTPARERSLVRRPRTPGVEVLIRRSYGSKSISS